MRTTLDIDEDILRVARHLAQKHEETIGRVLSDLARRGLESERRKPAAKWFLFLLGSPVTRPVTAQAVKDLLEAGL